MAPESQHKKLHNQILISKILQCKDGVSPVTLILDSLQQTGKPLIHSIITRAKASKVSIMFVALETLSQKGLEKVDTILPSFNKSVIEIQNAIKEDMKKEVQSLVIIDTIHQLLSKKDFNISSFLSSFMNPTTSTIILCHKDIPFPASPTHEPPQLSLLKYLATAILTVHSLTHIIAQKQARDRSIAEPTFGLDEGIAGVLVGMGSNYASGTVVEMEHRRKSGRTVKEWFFVYHQSSSAQTAKGSGGGGGGPKLGQKVFETVILLEEHPLYPRPAQMAEGGQKEEGDSTFNLELSEKERLDRDAVQLPYFDAQNESGVGAGGRILYDMGVEDDFDDEEDEL